MVDLGIGYGVAEALVEHGALVTISSSSSSRVDSAVAKLKKTYPSADSRITGYVCDIGDASIAEENIKTLFEKTGKLDHVVCTAGDGLAIVPVQDLTIEGMQKAGQVRFFAPLLIAKHAVSYLAGGSSSSITYTGGALAEKPIPGWVLVTAFAAGMQGIVRGLAIDLKPIRINVVQPGPVDTDIYSTSGIPDEAKQGVIADAKQRLPVGKMGAVEDLAEAYLYLMKDTNTTGAIVNSSGGMLVV